MSAINAPARIDNLDQMVQLAEPDFKRLAKVHGAVNFEVEASYALEILKNNDFLAKVAVGNQDSFKWAILKVASIGLSLSPVTKLAYLVPRKGRVCLDISYRGYIQLAVDEGAIKWAIAEIVYATDKFELRGLGQEPVHVRQPFASDRGEPVGAYCVAKTHDGEFITTTMSRDEIIVIRDRTESWISHIEKGKTTPWQTDGAEMWKKTVIRRASKSWPMTDTRTRLDEAIYVGSQTDEMDFRLPAAGGPALEPSKRVAKVDQVVEMLGVLNRTEEAFMKYAAREHKRAMEKVSDMTEQELDQTIQMLNELVDKQLQPPKGIT